MAIVKLPSGKWQVKVRLRQNGGWLTKAFTRKADAESQEAEWKVGRNSGKASDMTGTALRLSLDQYFEHWQENVPRKASKAWRADQLSLYRRYLSPILGKLNLGEVKPIHAGQVFQNEDLLKLSGARQLHVYVLIRALFQDAIDLYHLITFNPVSPKFRPRLIQKEPPHLSLKEIPILLAHVRGKPFGLAIWLQLFLGLRVGEMQALRWEDMDLVNGFVHIRRTFVKAEWRIQEYPKGRKHHHHRIPQELLAYIMETRKTNNGVFVSPSPEGGMITYKTYRSALKRYCREAGVKTIGTHGLRHSTGTLYVEYGASRDDLRRLFAHSSLTVTDRYVHSHGGNLERVADVIRLFPQMFHGAGKEKPNSISEGGK